MKNQKLFTNIVLLSCVIIFSVVVLEACYRFYLFGKDSFSVKKMNSVADIGVAGVIMTATHDDFNVAPDTLFKQKYNVLPTVRQFYHLFTIEELKKQFELQKQQIKLKIKQSRINHLSERTTMLSEPQRKYLSDIFFKYVCTFQGKEYTYCNSLFILY